MHGREELAGLVVERVGDPLDLFLQRLVEVTERLVGPLAVGDVARDAEDAHDLALVDLRRHHELAGDVAPRPGQDPQLEHRRGLAREDGLDHGGRAREVLGIDEGRERLAEPLGARPAGDRHEDGIQRLQPPVARERVDDVARRVDEVAVAVLGIAQRRVDFLDAAVGHLEGQQALDAELLARAEGPRAFLGRAALRQGPQQAPVLDRRHVEHAEPLGQRLPPHLVRLLERRLPVSGQIPLQRARVLGRELAHVRVHAVAPIHRATSTSASSVLRPQCVRM